MKLTIATNTAALFCLMHLSIVMGQSCLKVDTVQGFDLKEYASGPWYVQKQAENEYSSKEFGRCVTAEYTPKNSKTFWGYNIGVNNRAESDDGRTIGGDLCASSTNKSGQLQVAPCFLPKALAGPYWVVAYNEDQGYALVSGGQPKYVKDKTGCGPDGSSPCCKTGDGINNSGLW
jgi:lipocalin